MKRRSELLGVISLALAGLATAAYGAEFSATMVQKAPNQQDMESTLYVSGDMMREETQLKGQMRIRIHDRASNTMWLLNPQEKEFVEFSGQARADGAGVVDPPLPDEANSPCQQPSSGLSCTRLGVEEVNGREAEKWRFEATRQGQTVQWTEWFDKELRIPIRGEGPSGMVRELSDIEVGPQPDDLFRVPAGYQKIDIPQRGGQPRTGGGYR